MTEGLPSRIVTEIAFVGRGGGLVKALSGFRKGHHTLPDAANAATQAFLGKICTAELAADAEALFQATRSALGYKRTQISLNVASPAAVLTTRDFVVEFAYFLEEDAPARYATTTTLRSLRSENLARTLEFSTLFAGRFSEMSFAFRKGAKVEAVIDAIEALDPARGMTVTYPSDYAECEIAVADVEARVRCTPSALDLIFPSTRGPAELMDAFIAVRGAFAISRLLAGLLA